MNSRLPIAVGALFVRRDFNEKTKQEASEMVEEIRSEFIDVLSKVSWIDEQTRKKAIKKAKLMSKHIGYPDELKDNNKLEKYYKNLELEPDNFFWNTLRVGVFDMDGSFNMLRKPVNKTDWTGHSSSTDVDAYNSFNENSISTYCKQNLQLNFSKRSF